MIYKNRKIFWIFYFNLKKLIDMNYKDIDYEEI